MTDTKVDTLSRAALESEVLGLRAQHRADATGQREARDALVRSEERYRALFEAIDEGFCIIEFFDGPHGPLGDYVHVEANGGYARHTGIADIVGKTLREIAPAEADGWAALYGRVLATGEPVRFEREFATVRRHIEVSAARVDPPSRRQVSVLFRDITARKEAEAALRSLNETLEHRVEERTAELMAAEEQLRQSQKLEAVGQLTGGVAHDFNNLLTIIRSSIDFLKRDDLSAARRTRYVDAISETVDRASKLTSQLLAFARRQPLTPEVFDVSARVRSVSELIGPLVGSRILVEVEPCAGSCHVEADLSQFDTALVNLAVNARDAMDGEGRLTFSVREVAAIPAIRGHSGAPGDFVAVSVADTGHGISADQVASIFEPFYTTKEVGKGTGLGLSQVFGFTKQSGGEVEVVSTPGTGATFTLYLPRVSARPERGEIATGPAEGVGERSGDLRVLVVEDNDAVGAFADEMLRDLGYRTRRVGNAHDALALLESGGAQFDVVFSDVIMPGMNGVELACSVRRRWPALPVVLTSGYSTVLAQEGAHGFELLRKPYSADELSRALRAAADTDIGGSANGE